MRKETMAIFCPLQGVIDIIGKKWALLIINEIGNHGTIRFSELRNELRGVTAKSLTKTLTDLRNYGLITRRTYNEIPPRVEYSLTEEGRSLYKIIVPLIQWASSRKGAVVKECSCTALNRKDHQAVVS
jgi:DNA-binding HxlR family transcriptional regulator